MKILTVTILFAISLFGDEMQRINSIVQDITNLRKDYAQCQASLKDKKPIKVDMLKYQDNDDELRKYKRLLKDEREKNIILNNELNSLSLEYADMKSKKIDTKEKKLRVVEVVKIEKEKEVKVVEVVKLVEVCSNASAINPNPFPKLMPKETKVEKKIKTKMIKKTIVKEKKKTSSAKTYRLNKDSAIYDAPNSKEIDSWEKGSSFTSSEQTDKWIKITGYFVDKKFRGAKKSMWVEQTNAILR